MDSISKSFGGLRALSNLTFHIDESETLGIIGPNGAGKTTLFNVISGMRANSGRIRFKGEDISYLKPHEICHRGIARTFQLVRSFANLTLLENVTCGVLFGRKENIRLRLDEAKDKAAAIIKLVKLDHRINTLARELVFAERRRMELARALATGPSLILLDEMMAGLSAPEATEMVDIIMRLKREQGVTILMIEHVMKLITALCDRLVVLNFGQKLVEGKPSEVLRHPEVVVAYIGEEIA